MARRKNTKRIDPRYFLNETTHRDLNEEMSPDQAKNAVGIVLTKLKSQAPARQREPQGFIYSGVASVDPREGKVGVKVSPDATFVSHPGGTSSTYREESRKINPDAATSELRYHRGLENDLKRLGLSVSYYSDTAPIKFSFRGAMNRNNQFDGYIIEPL